MPKFGRRPWGTRTLILRPVSLVFPPPALSHPQGSGRQGVNTPEQLSSRHASIISCPSGTPGTTRGNNGIRKTSWRPWSQYLGKCHVPRYPELSLQMRIGVPGCRQPWPQGLPHYLEDRGLQKDALMSKAQPKATFRLVLTVMQLTS